MALSLSAQVAWGVQCKPHHFRAPYFLKTMGRCGFDQAAMSFHGDGVEQARCLMRGMDEEQAANFTGALKRLFLHVELI